MSPCTHLFSTHPSSNNTPGSTRVCWTRVWVQLESTIAWCKPPLHWNVSLLARGSLLAQNAWLTFMSGHSRQKCPKTFLPWHQHSPWWAGYSAPKRRDLGRESREGLLDHGWPSLVKGSGWPVPSPCRNQLQTVTLDPFLCSPWEPLPLCPGATGRKQRADPLTCCASKLGATVTWQTHRYTALSCTFRWCVFIYCPEVIARFLSRSPSHSAQLCSTVLSRPILQPTRPSSYCIGETVISLPWYCPLNPPLPIRHSLTYNINCAKSRDRSLVSPIC